MKLTSHRLIYTLSITCVLIFGFLGVSLITKNKVTPDEVNPTTKPPHLKVSQLQEENRRLRKRIEALKDSPKVEANKPEIEVAVIGENSLAGLDMENLRQQILERQQVQSEKKISLKLAALAEHLGLSNNQREEVRQLMVAKAAEKRKRFGRIFDISGKKTNGNEALEIVSNALSAGGREDTFDDDLATLLDDEQKEAYADYQANQRANMAEARANQDLAALQSMFELDSKQKDQAFDAFAELARQDLEVPDSADGILNAGRIIKQREKRIAALEPILTAEQMEVYQESPAASASTFRNLGDDIDGTTVIGTSITIDSPLKFHPGRKEN
ncbi:MAG: hypothetical protein GY899_07610 [Verrucomicrobiaceae bacterium]|nr:hypothetical protein [Verrucomicrobiaceae bacterium]